MAVYGASFVEAGADGPRRFAEICRQIKEKNARWLAASPTHLTIEHTVMLFEGAGWIGIRNAIDDEFLQRVSAELDADAITVGACDEIILSFSYRRFARGRLTRALEYAETQRADRRQEWIRVEGTREPWERPRRPR